MASLFKRRTRAGKLGSHWWASWKDHQGKLRTRSTGTTVEADARVIANGWESNDTLCREGHREPVDRRPIEQHLSDYEAKLRFKRQLPGLRS